MLVRIMRPSRLLYPLSFYLFILLFHEVVFGLAKSFINVSISFCTEFKWDDVKADKHRENYLGHSIKAPVGRWQKGIIYISSSSSHVFFFSLLFAQLLHGYISMYYNRHSIPLLMFVTCSTILSTMDY